MRTWLATASTALALVATLSAQTPSVAAILDLSGRYVTRFINEFSNVVAEESYIQDSLGNLPTAIIGRGAIAVATPARHRELKSDFLLVRTATDDWLPFRDVYEVDGQKVRDREGRLAKLFLQQSAASLEQATQISSESARYNLGAMQRTINQPILPLLFLDAAVQARFKYTLAKRDPASGDGTDNVWIVEFKETGRPTMVRGLRNLDIPANGRYWIDADTGRVLKTEVALDTPGIRARLTTSYRRDERFQIDVPFEMHEQYYLDRGQVTGTATYTHFRRFDVTSDETFQPPTAAQVILMDRKTGMTLVEIPSGRFTMGSTAAEPSRGGDETSHDVTINRPFFLGQREVTQQEWRTVMGTNPSRFADCGPRCPVENVTFADVQRFLAALNAQADNALTYRLPTEAEWEYACRAGTVTPFSIGETITTTQANYNGKQPYGVTAAGVYRERPARVAGFPPNAWGVSEMHGNVEEWVGDWYGAYPGDDVVDPSGPASGDRRSVRGGSWQSAAAAVRCAARSSREPIAHDGSIGFRVAADRVSDPSQSVPLDQKR